MKSFSIWTIIFVGLVSVRIAMFPKGGDGLGQVVFAAFSPIGLLLAIVAWKSFFGFKYEWKAGRHWLAVPILIVGFLCAALVIDFYIFFPEPYALRLR
jgi:hypothetical protein